LPESKVVLTSRTNYFRTDLEEIRVFLDPAFRDKDKLAKLELVKRPNFEIIHIEPLSQKQIIAFLKKRVPGDWKRFSEIIENTYDLKNLSTRPVLLEMICDTLPSFISQRMKEINSFDLYDQYTHNWIQKNVDEGRSFVDSQSGKLFMQELAWEMYDKDIYKISYEEIPERVAKHFKLEDAVHAESHEYDIRLQTYLVRNAEGEFFFAHRSFIEFLSAKKLIDEINSGVVAGLEEKQLTDEVLDFLALSVMNKDKEYLERLVELCETENKARRWNFTALFTRIKDQQLVTVILANREKIWNNAEVIWCLGERIKKDHSLDQQRVVDFLIERVSDSNLDDPWWNAAFALKTINEVRATPLDPISILVDNLDDQWDIEYSMNHYNDRRATVGVLRAVKQREQTSDGAANLIVNNWDSLKSTTKSAYNALWTLGELRSSIGISLLIIESGHDDFTIRNCVAEALGKIGKKEGIPCLVKTLLGGKNYRERRYAAESLGKIGDPVVIPELKLALESELDSSVRSMVQSTIIKLENSK